MSATDNPLDEAFIKFITSIYPHGESLTLTTGEREAAECAFYSGAAAAGRIIADDPRGRAEVVMACIAFAGRAAKTIQFQKPKER